MNLTNYVRQSILPLVVASVIPMVAMADDGDLPTGDVAVTIASAMTIALEQVDGSVVGVELEQEDGVTLWEVEVVDADSNTVEVVIDARSGAVIEVEADD